MSTTAQRAWAELNERQRLYLSTIFDADQAAVADRKRQSATAEKTAPASRWRRITYDIKIPPHAQLGEGHTSIQATLRRRGKHDPGSESNPRRIGETPAHHRDPRPGPDAIAGRGGAQ